MAVGDQAGPASDNKGIPMWVIIGGVGVVVVFLYLRKKNAGAGQTALVPAQVTDPNTGLPVDPLTGLPYITNPTQPQTNQTWALGAEQWATKHNISAALANKSIFDYLSGNELTPQESDILNKILSGFGFPPDILPFFGNPSSGGGGHHGGSGGGGGGGHGKPPKPHVNAGSFPPFISAILHSPLFKIPKGHQVTGGAPVYALVNTGYGPVYEQGQAVQNALAHGGQLFTLPQFSGYVQ